MNVYLYLRIWVLIRLLRYFLYAVPVCTWRPRHRKWWNQIQAVLSKGSQSSTHASWGLDDIIWVKRLKMFVLWHFYLKMATYIFKVYVLLFCDVMHSILTATWHIPDSMWHKNLFLNINVPLGLYCMIRTISTTNCLESPIQREVTNPKQLWLSAHFQQSCSVCLNW